jgi:sugar/nucleoside kinase (ribokinase family)
MVGCRGDDDFGDRLWAGVAAEGVDASGVRAVPGAASGLALIMVDQAGENSIAVAAGANDQVGGPEVAAAFAAACDVLVLSAEVPAGALAAALREAGARRVVTLLNLAPVPAAPGALLACRPDWLVVNAQEAGALLGGEVTGPADAEAAAAELAGGDGPRHVVITLGAAGAVLAGPIGPVAGDAAADDAASSGSAPGAIPRDPGSRDPGSSDRGSSDRGSSDRGSGGSPLASAPSGGPANSAEARPRRTVAVPGFPVASVDSVGAGDAFVGGLAVVLAAGSGPAEAVRAACAAGAATATRRGAQSALPRPQDVLDATGLTWPVPLPRL